MAFEFPRELVDPQIAVVAPAYKTRLIPLFHFIADVLIFGLKSALTLVVVPGCCTAGVLLERCFHFSSSLPSLLLRLRNHLIHLALTYSKYVGRQIRPRGPTFLMRLGQRRGRNLTAVLAGLSPSRKGAGVQSSLSLRHTLAPPTKNICGACLCPLTTYSSEVLCERAAYRSEPHPHGVLDVGRFRGWKWSGLGVPE